MLTWPRVHGPERARSAAMNALRRRAVPRRPRRSSTGSARHRRERQRDHRQPSAIQAKNGRSMPVSRRRKPMPIRLGGVPTGVASRRSTPRTRSTAAAPPQARRRLASPPPATRASAAATTPIGNIIAVVAVLLIHIEISALVSAHRRPARGRRRSPTPRSPRIANAKRRSSPWKKIARARMNVPMKRKISGSANGANADAPARRRARRPRRRRGTRSSPSGSPR